MKKDKDCNCPEHDAETFNTSSSDSSPSLDLDETQEQVSSSEFPSETPPNQNGDEDSNESFGAGTWHNNKKVSALWAKNETRNSWAAFTGMGWKKLNSSNDSSCVALTILAAHARQYNRNTKIKIDGGQVKEIYVW